MKTAMRKDKRSLSDVVRTWYTDTSIVGLSHASHAKPTWARAAWILIFAVGSVITVYQVEQVVQNFLEYPVVTSISLTHSDHVRWI